MLRIILCQILIVFSCLLSESSAYVKQYGRSQLHLSTACASTDIKIDFNIDKAIDESISSFITSYGKTLKLHPGLSFGLGCDEWIASDYSGSITNWKLSNQIDWMSKSVLKHNKPNNINIDKSTILHQINYDILSSYTHNIPHMKLRYSRTMQEITIFMDYIPRLELLHNIHYYDTYYKGLDSTHYNHIQQSQLNEYSMKFIPSSMSVITNLISSPLKFHIGFNYPMSQGEVDFIQQIIKQHLHRWKDWISQHTSSSMSNTNTNTNMNTNMNDNSNIRVEELAQRDENLYQYVFQEHKFSYASVLGGSFAPKAEELALCMMGPHFIPKNI